MDRSTRVIVTVLAVAAVLCVMGCTPTATFMRTGESYYARAHAPRDIAVYFLPNSPERPHRLVGSIIVSPNRNVRNQDAYLEELRKRAAEEGVDGVMNVTITQDKKKESSGGCINGTPYYYQDNYTLYEVRGDAFVWGD